MRRLVTAVVACLCMALVTTSVAEPTPPAQAAKKAKKKCFKKKHGKRVRVKCPKKKKKAVAPTPVNPNPTPEPTPAPPAPSETTGQAAIDQMTNELKGGRWRQFTSSSFSSTVYVLNLCADGTFLRTAESGGVQVYRYGTWKVTEAGIPADGSARAAHVVGKVTASDPPPDGSDYVADLSVRTSDSQWFWGDDPAQYFTGAAVCHD